MKRLLFVTLLLTGSFLLAQDSYPAGNHQDSNSKGDATVQGCLGRSGGDFILTKQNPAITYQLHGTHKIRLSHYLGQRVEVSGSQTPTMSTSSDAINKMGSAAPVTINVMSIRTIDKECTAR
jgi:hypothetical protein